jgi:hypothetical protein
MTFTTKKSILQKRHRQPYLDHEDNDNNDGVIPNTDMDGAFRTRAVDTCQPTKRTARSGSEIHSTEALQAYLIRQQQLAGISPDKIITMQGHRLGQGKAPNLGAADAVPVRGLLQITEDGVFVPQIPPAQFNSVIPPLPKAVISRRGTSQLVDMNRISSMRSGRVDQPPPQPVFINTVRERILDTNFEGGEDMDVQLMEDPRKAQTVSRYNPRIPSTRSAESRPTLPMTLGRGDRNLIPGHDKLPSGLQLGRGTRQGGASRLPQRPEPSQRFRPTKPSSDEARTNSGFGMDIIESRSSNSISRYKRGGFGSNRTCTVRRPFNILQAIILREDLVYHFARLLTVNDLVSLYAISKEFHYMVNKKFTSVVLEQATQKALDSAVIFPFRCYRRLCIPDPASNRSGDEDHIKTGELRLVPSFRWLRMVCWREAVVNQIMVLMDKEGLAMPKKCTAAIKKLWFLMDIPDNNRRIGIVQNDDIWSDTDLFFATMFFVKLDMRFTDPINGSGRDCMRRLLLAQPSLTMLYNTLAGKALRTPLDILKAYVRWKYRPEALGESTYLFGVPPRDVGTLQFEGYGRTGSRVRLQRPDELILKESVRRELNMEQKYLQMFLWGHVKPNTMKREQPNKERSLTFDTGEAQRPEDDANQGAADI